MADPVICQADLQGTSSEEYFFFALISRSFLMVGPLAEMSSFALTFNRGKLGLIRLKERPWLCVAHAWVLVYTGQLEAMEPCLQNAEAVLREAAGAALWPANRIEYDRSLALLHESMDETMLAAAWAAGRAMSTEQVMTDTVTGRI